jgi:TIR domain-containing protein
MEAFLSYSRKDQAYAEMLTEGLKRLGHNLWFDRELSGGAEWWEAILEHIRAADVFLAVVSKASLASTACSREREYALALGKPILPVLVEPVSTQMLPNDIVQRQLVDFTTPDMTAAFHLAGGFAALPPPRPLPDPPPTPPEIPLSYLSEISQQIYARSLTRDQQLMIVAKLREAISDEEDYDIAVELARLLEGRDDLYVATQRQLREVLGDPRPGTSHEPADVTTKKPNHIAQSKASSRGPAKSLIVVLFILAIVMAIIAYFIGFPPAASAILGGIFAIAGAIGALFRRRAT